MDKSTILVTLIVAAICVGLGIIIGYFAIDRSPDTSRGNPRDVSDKPSDSHLDTCIAGCREGACQADSCEIPLPRTYVAYHLQGKTINLDGRIDEEAWSEVSQTEDFVDLRGLKYTKPRFDSRVKIRWDNTNLYVAAFLQEDDIWANKTLHDSKVWQDNAFELYVDTDGSTHNYKEFQVNALKTTWDLLLTKAYIDGGQADSSWESNAQIGLYTDGAVNDPNSNNEYWSVEIALPFTQLRWKTLQANEGAPKDMDIWKIVLARPEWGFQIVDGQYVKDESVEASWWSWQPHGAVSLHLPDRWGLLQFSRGAVKSTSFTPNEQWKISQALFDVFNAMKKYHGVFGLYTDDKSMLDLPQYLLTGYCVEIPQISLLDSGFVVSISSKNRALQGHIRADRYLWFGDRATGLAKV
ncbi:uncharacterized protein LOC135468561 isoform X3 [Liolophura sinensis]|uniref:uncharacterized protein LOC135468561 isoform X3 n=1 Tax=Liolophura sinensis TaxID=3198878 RepID=UPI0031597327